MTVSIKPVCAGFSRILQDRGLSSYPGLLERVTEIQDSCASPYLSAFLVDLYEDALETNHSSSNQQETLKKALEVRFYFRLFSLCRRINKSI